MTADSLKEAIKRQLPEWLRQDPEIRDYILELTGQDYAKRRERRDWFHELLGELRRDREGQSRQWEEFRVELQRDREEQGRKLD